MPLYEFFCKDCKKEFSRVLTLGEYEKGEFTCPTCQGRNVEQLPASFFAVTSKKS
ncbi:MAG TPA: FmdB family zinc ribbon protein [Candidatus Xenobia bacterium]|nr:FmdB family zinc ribbon protein [Candidatus Xenobia bacterium]